MGALLQFGGELAASQVAEAAGVSLSRVRTLARAGILRPQRGPRGWRYTLADVAMLRRVRTLSLRALRALERRSIAPADVFVVGKDVVIRDRGKMLVPRTGQVLLDFHQAVVSTVVTRLNHSSHEDPPDDDVESVFEQALESESADSSVARVLYERVLTMDPEHWGARINLGRLLQMGGDLSAAERHYRVALMSDSQSPAARFNLGLVVEKRGRLDEAVRLFLDVVELDPRHAQAHRGLARIYMRAGSPWLAIKHQRLARKLTLA